MAKHTPGPWSWAEDRFHDGYSGIVGPDGQEVLFPNHANDGDEGAAWFEDFPSDADRNLIIAAPDMYDALKDLLTVFDRCEAGLPPSRALRAFVRDIAEKALAKAEGKTFGL